MDKRFKYDGDIITTARSVAGPLGLMDWWMYGLTAFWARKHRLYQPWSRGIYGTEVLNRDSVVLPLSRNTDISNKNVTISVLPWHHFQFLWFQASDVAPLHWIHQVWRLLSHLLPISSSFLHNRSPAVSKSDTRVCSNRKARVIPRANITTS